MSAIYSKISLIIPTYNCNNELKNHLLHMKPILKYFGQIIAVDSYSTDGTFETLKDKLSKYNSEIYQRERGLYSSWNDAISRSSCEYIYISTIGDLPSLGDLKKFFETAIKSNADISLSPPNVVKESMPGFYYNNWPIHRIINNFNIPNPIILDNNLASELNTYSALHNCFASLSGSFASNISKTHILKNNPFPTDFEGIGDVVWWAQISNKVSIMIYPHFVSSFILHQKSYDSLSSQQSKKFINAITQTLKINTKEKATYEKFTQKILSKRALQKKYKFFRLFTPVYYYYKFCIIKMTMEIDKIIEKYRCELTHKLINCQRDERISSKNL